MSGVVKKFGIAKCMIQVSFTSIVVMAVKDSKNLL